MKPKKKSKYSYRYTSQPITHEAAEKLDAYIKKSGYKKLFIASKAIETYVAYLEEYDKENDERKRRIRESAQASG